MKTVKNFIKSIFNYEQEGKSTGPTHSIMPAVAVDSIENGKLLEINTRTIVLSHGETCHYIDRAILVTEKNRVTGYTGGTGGWSIRVMKGVSYRVGNRKGRAVRENVKEFTKGILYITNKRVIFASYKNGFEKKINSISVITPYANAVILQFGSSTYSLLLPDGNIVLKIFNLLRY